MAEIVALKDWIARTLKAELAPWHLDVIDESHLHAGHAGWRETGETHFRVDIVSAVFAGKTRIERHRLVHALLNAAFQRGLHALTVRARTPAETV